MKFSQKKIEKERKSNFDETFFTKMETFDKKSKFWKKIQMSKSEILKKFWSKNRKFSSTWSEFETQNLFFFYNLLDRKRDYHIKHDLVRPRVYSICSIWLSKGPFLRISFDLAFKMSLALRPDLWDRFMTNSHWLLSKFCRKLKFRRNRRKG